MPDKAELRNKKIQNIQRLNKLLIDNLQLKERFDRIKDYAKKIRTSEYHVTNACNIRCKGCWFFEFDHDKDVKEVKEINILENFMAEQREKRGINTALVIGGEPALFLDRLHVIKKNIKNLTVSTNGLIKIPYIGLEEAAIALTLFGGGPIDDQLRAIKPSGARFSGLFDQVLDNYKNDQRAVFIYAVSED